MVKTRSTVVIQAQKHATDRNQEERMLVVWRLNTAQYQFEPSSSPTFAFRTTVRHASPGITFACVCVYVDRCVRLSFGTQEVDDADLLVAAIGIDEDDLRSVLADIKGQPCGLERLGQGLRPMDGGVGEGQQQQQQRQGGDASKGRERLKKLYKITEEELAVNSLEDCVIMRMAVKDH